MTTNPDALAAAAPDRKPGTVRPGEPADRPEPTPAQLLHKIRWDVYRLAIHTQAPIDPRSDADLRSRRRGITRDPLLATLREAIRPNQGGTDSGRGGAASTRIPIDQDALTLYDETVDTIATMHEGITGRPPRGTPEQLLMEWFHDFERDFRKGDLTTLQLTTYQQRLARTRRAIESHFDPPTTREIALCPTCGYTHMLRDDHGIVVQTKCVQLRFWPYSRTAIAECRHCGTTWTGHVLPSGPTEGIRELYEAIDANVEHYGPIDFVLAPLPEPDTEETPE